MLDEPAGLRGGELEVPEFATRGTVQGIDQLIVGPDDHLHLAIAVEVADRG